MNKKFLSIGSTLMFAMIALTIVPSASAGDTNCAVEFAVCQCSSEYNHDTGEWERCDGYFGAECSSSVGAISTVMIGTNCDYSNLLKNLERPTPN